MLLTSEQSALRRAAREFTRNEISPRAQELDRLNAWDPDLWERIRGLGVTGIPFPETSGGAGGSFLDYALVTEEMARGSAAAALMPALNVGVGRAIELYASASARERYLSPLVRGDLKACWAFTEPATGSDPKAVQTRAVRCSDGWLLTGQKTFISHSSTADVGLVFASVAGRLTAFLADTNQEGWQSGPRYDLLGLRGADTGDLHLEDLKVSADAVLGEVGDGMRVLVGVEAESKVRACAMCVGMAQAALDEAVSYARTREHRGVPIGEKFASIQSLIADIAACVAAARWVTYHAAACRDAVETDEFVALAATARLVAAQSARRAASLSMQVHGAYGYVQEAPIARIYRDAKAYEMIQGTLEIQRAIVARGLLAANRPAQFTGSG
jgi:alkylation response protein AidB-like acyl-CoA dehydrogenase